MKIQIADNAGAPWFRIEDDDTLVIDWSKAELLAEAHNLGIADLRTVVALTAVAVREHVLRTKFPVQVLQPRGSAAPAQAEVSPGSEPQASQSNWIGDWLKANIKGK